MIRVVVVDDQALVRRGFQVLLRSEPDIEVVGEAGDGDAAVALARELRPDVMLMDIRMPVTDGLTATRAITSQPGAEGTRVLILTTFDRDEYVFEALRSGASGFLLKDVEPEGLLDAVRVVAAGDSLLAPRATRRLIEEFVALPAAGRAPSSPALQAQLAALTEREREVLVAVARGATNQEIADALVVSYATVKTHVSHLLAKLEARDRAQLVVVAYESGLVAPGSPAG